MAVGTRKRAARAGSSLGEEVVLDVERRREGVHGVVDRVLERALLGREAVAHLLELGVVLRGRELGLDARLEAGLGLGLRVAGAKVWARTTRAP